VIRGDIDGVCCDRHWSCQVNLLPATRRFAGEGCRRQGSAGGAPEVGSVRAGVLRTLVEADGGEEACGYAPGGIDG
jgi:hypothetical protein